jgi:hypothetical protein
MTRNENAFDINTRPRSSFRQLTVLSLHFI